MKTESDVASAPATRGRTLDHAAGLYDWLSPAMMFWQEGRLGREAQRLLALRGDERVLDVGCATGWLTRRIAAALTAPDACAVGLDAAPKMIAAARRKAAGQGADHACIVEAGPESHPGRVSVLQTAFRPVGAIGLPWSST